MPCIQCSGKTVLHFNLPAPSTAVLSPQSFVGCGQSFVDGFLDLGECIMPPRPHYFALQAHAPREKGLSAGP
jgi:hypothetical protein